MSPMYEIAIFGARGLLGTALCGELGSGSTTWIHAISHADCDITEEAQVRKALRRKNPRIIVNCAAFTKVDDCEARPEHARQVNGRGPGILARIAREREARFVHISTDYVFDGRKQDPYVEDDPTGPDAELSVYGRTKLEGERAVAEAGGDWLIVRTSWVFGPAGPNFVATILNAAREKPELRVVNDQRGRPTYAPDLAAAIASLLNVKATGFVHAANADPCTWYDFAREIVRQAGLPTAVHPCTTAEFPRPARRPANSVLSTARFESLTGGPMRSWRDALRDYLQTVRPSSEPRP